MTPVDMLELHDPDNGGVGDCLRAVVASLLDLPAEDVPHFVRLGIEAGDDEEWSPNWYYIMIDFLSERGYNVVTVGNPKSGEYIPEAHIACGPSPRGVNHVVVAEGDRVIHDPHPSRAGVEDILWRMELRRSSGRGY